MKNKKRQPKQGNRPESDASVRESLDIESTSAAEDAVRASEAPVADGGVDAATLSVDGDGIPDSDAEDGDAVADTVSDDAAGDSVDADSIIADASEGDAAAEAEPDADDGEENDVAADDSADDAGEVVDDPLQQEPEQLDFFSMETPEELITPHRAPIARPNLQLPPLLDRPRPERPPVVRRWVWITIAVLLGITVIAVAAWAFFDTTTRRTVPDVLGSRLTAAESKITEAGLTPKVTERRFSSKPPGQVLEQSPRGGTVARRGDVVELVVSAGTEEVIMPDVVGNGINLARSVLEAKGLVISIERVTSQAASDTVLSTVPSAGAVVRTGDVVRVQVATPSATGGGLQPFKMQGVSVIIDPAPVAKGSADVTLDIARRLRSLLEASGASVTVLRSGTVTQTTDAARAAAAARAGGTVAVGLAVDASGPGGRSVVPPLAAPLGAESSERFANALVSQLTTIAPPATKATGAADPVFGSLQVPWVRLHVGSTTNRSDATSFNDPRWADHIAQAIYGSLGEVFGVKEEL